MLLLSQSKIYCELFPRGRTGTESKFVFGIIESNLITFDGHKDNKND